MTEMSYHINSPESMSVLAGQSSQEQDMSTTSSVNSCIDDARQYPVHPTYSPLVGVTTNAHNSDTTDEQYHANNRESQHILHTNYDVPPRNHQSIVETMFRDVHNESPAVTTYGSNIPYSPEQISTLHHMWHAQEGENAKRLQHMNYANTEMVKHEPSSSITAHHGTTYTQRSADMAAEMAAMEKASIDFLTGSYFRSRMHNTRSAPVADARCSVAPSNHIQIKTDCETAGVDEDTLASGIDNSPITSNIGSSSATFKTDECQASVSIAYSPVMENENSSINNSAVGNDSQLSTYTEDHPHTDDISTHLSSVQDDNENDALQNMLKDVNKESNESTNTFHDSGERNTSNMSHQQKANILGQPTFVSLTDAQKGIMKAISYLKAHPEIAGNNVKTLQRILERLRRRKKHVVKRKKKKNLPPPTVFPLNYVEVKEETVPKREDPKRKNQIKAVDAHPSTKSWKSRPNKCTLCFKRFVHKHNLQKHFEKCCDRNPSKCTVCNKIFSTQRALSVHKRTHTGEKPYLCTTCGQSFTQKDSLQKHQTIHTGEMLFSCELCDKKFARASYVKNHMVTHSEGKEHMCSQCGKSYRRSCELQVHIRCHTNDRRYKCSHCDKGFTRLTTLNDHERTHTGEKPHKCDVCGQSFAQSCALRNHKRTHTGERPYSCSVCGETFSHSGSLYHHKKIHRVDRQPKKKYNMHPSIIVASQQQTMGVSSQQDTFTGTSGHDSVIRQPPYGQGSVPIYPHYAYDTLPKPTGNNISKG